MFVNREQPGCQELYPENYVMRYGQTQLKGYSGRIGGHFILMFNGWLTVIINWILLVIVLIYFTPAIFP